MVKRCFALRLLRIDFVSLRIARLRLRTDRFDRMNDTLLRERLEMLTRQKLRRGCQSGVQQRPNGKSRRRACRLIFTERRSLHFHVPEAWKMLRQKENETNVNLRI